MKHQLSLVCAAAAALVVIGCSGSNSPATPTPTPTNTRIIGLSGNLAFGNVSIGQETTALLTITNSGNSTLTVTGMTVPTGTSVAYTGSWTHGTIAAGASQPVTIFFKPVAAQVYSGSFGVDGDQTSGTNTINISGTGVNDDTSPLTLTEIAPTMAQAVASAISGAMEGDVSAANMSAPPTVTARLLALVLPQTVYASSFSKGCRSGGNVSISGVSVSGRRYSLSGARASFVGCGWNAGRKTATADGTLSLNGDWCAGDVNCSHVVPSGSLTVATVGAVPVGGTIGLTEYSISIGGAGIQNGKTDTPPPPNPNSCPATLSSTSFAPGVSGGAFAVTVTVGPTCPWTAGSNSGFITVTGGSSGPGNGNVSFSVSANTGASRTGTLSIAGQTVVVSQSGQTPAALNIAGTWLETFSASASTNNSQTVDLTQSSSGAIGGAARVPSPQTDVFSGTVSGSSVSGLTEVWRYSENLGGASVNCTATVRYAISQASSTSMTGTFSSAVSCSIVSPVPIPPLPTTTDSGNVRFTKQ